MPIMYLVGTVEKRKCAWLSIVSRTKKRFNYPSRRNIDLATLFALSRAASCFYQAVMMKVEKYLEMSFCSILSLMSGLPRISILFWKLQELSMQAAHQACLPSSSEVIREEISTLWSSLQSSNKVAHMKFRCPMNGIASKSLIFNLEFYQSWRQLVKIIS